MSSVFLCRYSAFEACLSPLGYSGPHNIKPKFACLGRQEHKKRSVANLVCPRVLDGVHNDVRRLVLKNAAVLEYDLTLNTTFGVLCRLHVNLKSRIGEVKYYEIKNW